jgi:hypothetical protein
MITTDKVIEIFCIADDFCAEYISPQKNRAVKNKSYFYNCYGKEEEFYIENQG